jgi:SAM-dependent methyltransferase
MSEPERHAPPPGAAFPAQLRLFSEGGTETGPLTRAALLDAVYDTRRADLGVYLGLAMGVPGPVLELGAGGGRLLGPLLARGIDAFGLECAGDALDLGWRRLSALGKSGFRRRLIAGDMRDFDLGQRFSLVFIPCNTLSLLQQQSDLEATFDSVRRHLKPEGALVFDVTRVEGHAWQQPPHVWQSESEALWVRGVAASSRESGSYDPSTRRCRVTRDFQLVDGRSAQLETLTYQRSIQHILTDLEHRGLSPFGPIDECGGPLRPESTLAFIRCQPCARPALGYYY